MSATAEEGVPTMQDLHVLAVEDGALVAVSDGGERFRIPIDAALQSKLRQAQPVRDASPRLSPREIQSRIRSGLSAEEVAEATGVSVDDVRRFEGPVLAEREYIVTSALAVPVRTAADAGTDPVTFGGVIEDRLETASAAGVSWTAWKDQAGEWIVRLLFTADRVDHDARWTFDPKRQALSPSNAEAVTLSQQGEAAGVLIPRLRAVSVFETPTETGRFDSDAFVLDGDAEPEAPHSQTADLLEALRRRRGEREAAPYAEELGSAPADHPALGRASGIRLVEVPIEELFDQNEDAAASLAEEDVPLFETDLPADDATGPKATGPEATGPDASSTAATGTAAATSADQNDERAGWTVAQPTLKPVRRGRATMPSWDDIVFGTRPDDDLA